MRDLPTRAIDYRPVSSLIPTRRNARTHSRKQIRQIAASIERFGFTNPVLVDDEASIIAGQGRVAAAKLLGIDQIPVIALDDLSPKERQAYALADNKLALNAGWDQDLLALEFQELIDAGFEGVAAARGLAPQGGHMPRRGSARRSDIGMTIQLQGNSHRNVLGLIGKSVVMHNIS